MKLLLSTPGLSAQDRKNVERHLHHVMPNITKRLGRHDKDSVMLRVRLTDDTLGKDRKLYHITFTLQLPEHPVIVHKDGHDLHELVKEGEVALKKELRRCVAKIRRDHLRRKRSTHKVLFESFSTEMSSNGALPSSSSKPIKTSDEREAHPIFARLRPILTHLNSYAQEHIRSAIEADELPDDYLAPSDLVDQAIVAMIESDKNLMTDPVILERSLFQEIDHILEGEIKERNQNGSKRISIETGAPADEKWGVVGVEAEEMEYHKPYEALKMEDVLEDHETEIPSHSMSEIEEHRLILQSLSGLSAKARSAFFLGRVEGFENFEIAMIQNRDESEVQNDIKSCVEVLTNKINSIGQAEAVSS